MGTDYFNVLGLPRDATHEEVRNAYFEAARRFHPDVNPDPAYQESFLVIQEAYEVLSNPQKKAAYLAGLQEDPGLDTVIALQAFTSYSRLAPLDEPQLYYVLLRLNCLLEKEKNSPPPLNLCLVIDRSTSMQGTRMDMVKANLIHLGKKMRPEDVVSVVMFSDRADVVIPPAKYSMIDNYSQKINQIHTGGGTEIFRGLNLGYQQVKQNLHPNSINHLFLLTDGQTYGDEHACLTLADEATREGIAITALGIGHDWNDQFLDRLTEISGGSTSFVSTPNDLEAYFQTMMDELGMVFAKNVTLEFESDPQISLHYAFRLKPDACPLLLKSPCSLGKLHFNNRLEVLLEFLVQPFPEGTGSIRIIDGRIKMEIPHFEVTRYRKRVEVQALGKANPERELPPAEIIGAISRLTLYRMQENSRQEVLAGRISQATRRLQYLATNLLSQGDKSLAQGVLQEADHLQKENQFSQGGDKRIKYGTRALLLLPSPQEKE